MTKPKSKRKVAAYTVKEIRAALSYYPSVQYEIALKSRDGFAHEFFKQLRKNRAKKKGK